MFPHEEFLVKALEESSISPVVRDLGALYSTLVASGDFTTKQFEASLKVQKILDEAADRIALIAEEYEGLPRIPHPRDKKNVEPS